MTSYLFITSGRIFSKRVLGDLLKSSTNRTGTGGSEMYFGYRGKQILFALCRSKINKLLDYYLNPLILIGDTCRLDLYYFRQ